MRNSGWMRRASLRPVRGIGKSSSLERLEARTLFSAPVVTATSPSSFGLGVGAGAKVSVTFNEPIDRTSVDSATFTLRDSTDAAVPAVVTYNDANATATLDAAAPLAYATTYTARVSGGVGGVVDAEGESLAADYAWSFMTAADPTSGPGGPILVVTNASNPFASYYPEILRAEGLNEFATADVGAVSPALLAPYQVVLLGETSLSPTQVAVLGDWVTGGGNLVAMRPDKQLAGLLGLSDAGATLPDSYLSVNTASGPGAGITDQTIQYHGVADQYALSGAAAIATLYSDAATPTARPAVTLRSVGANGGQAAAFTYDLARSIVYTRQGNPAWVGQERDGQSPIRSDDLFFGNKAGDPQPDYVDLNKVAIPQADEQQRLLANLIGQMNLDNNPLPRFWYFPRGAKAVVVMSGDDHANGGTVGRFNTYIANSPAGSSPDDWTAVRSSSYVYPNTPITDAQAAAFTAAGFEIGLHPNTGELNYTPASLEQVFATQLAQFHAAFPSLPSPSSSRTHAIVWSDYSTQPQVELNHRIRLDENYYYWPGSWVQDRPGLFTGSGMPMRFATAAGNTIDVYQATTQMTDESGQTYPKNINVLLDNALGPTGYYGAFTANMHTDSAASAGSTAIIAAAQARGVPVVSGRQMLAWLDGRNGSSFGSIQWDAAASTLSFTVTSADGAAGLAGMLPTHSAGALLSGMTVNGAAVPFTVQTIKGVEYAFYPAAPGNFVAQYVPDTTAPAVSNVLAAPGASQSEAITWTTDEPATSRVDYGTSPSSLTLGAQSDGLTTGHRLVLGGLVAGATYYYRVTSADFAGNPTTSPSVGNAPASFTVPTGQFGDTTVGDFAAGSGDANTYLAQSGDGELTLAGVVATEFAGTALPGGWSSTPWNAGGGVAVAGGNASVDGTLLAATATFSPGHSMEFVATFGGAAFQHAGLGTDLNAVPWAIFSTGSTGGSLRARTASGATTLDTPIPGNWIGAPHLFRLDWTASSVGYSIDGVRVVTHAVAVPGPVRPVASDSNVDGNAVTLDWVYLTPYATPATFLSRVFGAGSPVVWSSVEWDAQTPAGTSLSAYLRTGDTPTPDPTWSDFAPVTVSGAPLNSAGRYAQYRLDLATTDPDQAPVVQDVSVFYVGDQTAPTITARSPVPGAAGVAVATTISVTFSEAIDPATIGAATLRLRAAGAATDTAASVSYDPATRTATLTPAALLSGNSSYQVTVSGSVRDLAGNTLGADSTWGFATVDTIAPTVVARSPAPGATGVSPGTVVAVTFSEAMNPATINGSTFQLRDAANNFVAAIVAYNAATNTATLTPSAQLGSPATFTVTVSGATDLAGNAMTVPVTWGFITADVPPAVIAKSPAAGTTAVTPATTVTVTFSESIQSRTLSFVLKTASGSTVQASVSYNDSTRTATLTPKSSLSSATTYTATVSGAKDLAGNVMAAAVSWSFTTVVPWVQTTQTDFGGGTQSGTAATNTAGGEVRLASPVFEDFNTGTALPSTWTSLSLTPSGGGPTSVTVSGGVLSVAGANVLSNQTFAGAPVEGRVQFGAAANQSFGATNDAGTNFAVFTTKNTTNSLYAQVSANGTISEVRIGVLPSGFHVYRVSPVATGFEFYVDGSRKATIARTLPAGTILKASVAAFYGSPKPAILADWVHVLSYAPSGLFTSGVFDATRVATWGTITFNGTVPAGTTMVVEVSSGNTATRDGTWSAWTRVTSGATIAAPTARYLQYRVTFTTTNSTVTAVLTDLTITWK